MNQSQTANTSPALPWSRRASVLFAALAMAAAMLPAGSEAAVEFVTGVGDCVKSDTQVDNKPLSVQAGNNLRFEVWGDGIDINPSVRVTVDDSNNDALVTARIIRAHNGAANLLRGCKIAKGSVELEVDSPAEAGATRLRSLHFRMPLGDESRLQMRVVPFRTPVWTISNVVQRPANCLSGTGTLVRDLNNARLTISLPPGANRDSSNCELEIDTLVAPEDRPEIDIQGSFRYTISAPLLTLRFSGVDTFRGALESKHLVFTANVADIRRTTALRSVTFRLSTPNPNRSDTLALVINPPATAIGFTQACACRNATTGTTINANDDFQCEIRLSQQPPAGGQLISLAAEDRLCVASGASNVLYSSASGLGSFTAPGTGTFHLVSLRARSGSTSASPPSPCASPTSPVSHTLKFWVGPQGATSGPAYTQCQIRIRAAQ